MKKLLFAALLSAGATGAGAQTFPATWGSRMQAVLDSVNTVNGNAVGITAAVYMPGYGLWTGATGISAPGEPMTTDMRVLIGSNSKLFLAATMLKLQEAGVLSLDDHIGRWIHTGPTSVDTTATIRQLLGHVSGMADYANDQGASYYAFWSSDTSAVYLAQTDVDSAGAPVYPKGRGFHYSNSGYALCSMIIEAATGQPYWQVLRAQVLSPLSMDSTYVPVFEPYQPIAGTNYQGALYTGYFCTSFATASPGNGEIASTPQEMVQWYQNIFNGTALTPASMQQLLDINPASAYGLGIAELISPRLGGMYYHSGAVGAFTSEAMYDKDTRASIFIALNTIADGIYTGNYLAPLLDVFTREMPMPGADVGVAAILDPAGTTCEAFTHPVVKLKNYGGANLTKAVVSYNINGSFAGSYTWEGTMVPGDSVNVTLPAGMLSNGANSIAVSAVQPAYLGLGHEWNNALTATINANISGPYPGYFSEDFEGSTTPVFVWTTNSGMELQAGVTDLTGYNSAHALVRGCNNNSDYGNVSNIDLPLVHLTAGSSPALSFRYAYKHYPGNLDDSLQVLISANCGATWTSLFHEGGESLSGGNTSSDQQYYPQTTAEWITEHISLAAYTGDVLVRFRQRNGFGQNIYIDDIAAGTPTDVMNVAAPVVRVHPNPADNTVSITGLTAGTPIRLTTLTGQTILEAAADNGNTTLDISRLVPGMYLVSTPLGTRKLVKQ